MKKAFTLIELVIAISILSIVIITSGEYVAFVYGDFIEKERLSRFQNEVKSASQIILKLLNSSIKESIVSVENPNYANCKSIHASDGTTTVLMWLGDEMYGKLGEWSGDYYLPYWSGVVNLDKSSKNAIVDPLSDFDKEEELLAQIEPSYSMSVYLDFTSADSCSDFYTNTHAKIHEVEGSGDKLTFKNSKPDKLSERYHLAASAYALTVENGSELVLYYDFYPWKNQTYTNGKRAILGKNISGFSATSDNGLVRINICSNSINESNETICVEKAIF